MSTQAVTEFLEQLANDDAIMAELNLQGKTRQERIVATVELAGKRGFEFTGDECATVIETVQKVQNGELEEAELEKVAGGTSGGTWEPSFGMRMTIAVQGFVDWLAGSDDDDEDDDADSNEGSNTGTAVAGIRG